MKLVNTLLRINKVTGPPPAPFYQPNEKMDFWVLELRCHHKSFALWCGYVSKILSRHKKLLQKLHKKGSRAALFIQMEAWDGMPEDRVTVLKPNFLLTLAHLNISLEICVMSNRF